MRKHPLTLALALLCTIAATAQSANLTQTFMIPLYPNMNVKTVANALQLRRDNF